MFGLFSWEFKDGYPRGHEHWGKLGGVGWKNTELTSLRIAWYHASYESGSTATQGSVHFQVI